VRNALIYYVLSVHEIESQDSIKRMTPSGYKKSIIGMPNTLLSILSIFYSLQNSIS
jgi:hypothetical protein